MGQSLYMSTSCPTRGGGKKLLLRGGACCGMYSDGRLNDDCGVYSRLSGGRLNVDCGVYSAGRLNAGCGTYSDAAGAWKGASW